LTLSSQRRRSGSLGRIGSPAASSSIRLYGEKSASPAE
jgi:hypothetical protein